MSYRPTYTYPISYYCNGELKTLSLQRSDPSHPQIRTKMSSSFSNPTELFWAMVCSGGERLRTGDPWVNPAELCDPRLPTGDATLEATVARVQLPVGSQPESATYEASTARTAARFLMIRTNVSQARPHENGLGGHLTIQRTHRRDRGSRNMNCKVRTVCTDCDKSFGRAQELTRHKKDVHESPRNCLFCGFKWTRPSNIKAHLFAKHSSKFTAENLFTIQALRGRMIVAFLDAYN